MFSYSIVLLVAGLGILVCVLAARAFYRWQGWLRWTMAIPFFLTVGVSLNIAIAIMRDPTSHNLWPIELIFWYVAAGILVGILYLLRWLGNRLAASQG
jgi:hypothetical protein